MIVSMKLVTFSIETVLGTFSRIGALAGDSDGYVVDLNACYAWFLAQQKDPQPQRLAGVIVPPDMLAFLQMGERAMEAAEMSIAFFDSVFDAPENAPKGVNNATILFDLNEVTLKTPLPNPNLYRDFYTFEGHVATGFKKRNEPVPDEWYEMPVYYKGNHRSFIGTDETVTWPEYAKILDYELEIACIIGKQGKNISVEEAGDYIAGYAILNDFSARDVQKKEMKCRLGPAKGKDFCTAVGPYLVTKDELADIRNLKAVARVNGEIWTDSTTSEGHFSFEQMIAHASKEETLYPGDVLGSGTVNNGCGLEHGNWLKDGDVIELDVEGLGVLRNTIVKR